MFYEVESLFAQMVNSNLSLFIKHLCFIQGAWVYGKNYRNLPILFYVVNCRHCLDFLSLTGVRQCS